MVIRYPTSMSDLNNGGIKEDSFICRYIELTNKSVNIFKFPFDLNKYSFLVRRVDSCHREKFIKCKPPKGRTFVIEQEILYNGDCVYLTYMKKN